jgi:hypothetical protein
MRGLMAVKQLQEKSYIGKVLNYYKEPKVVHFLMESGEISAGDKILILGDTTGVIETNLKEFYLNDRLAEHAVKADEVTFVLPDLVRKNDRIYKLENVV